MNLFLDHTTVDWSSFCREVILDAFIVHRAKIGGPNIVVEIGELKFGKQKTIGAIKCRPMGLWRL